MYPLTTLNAKPRTSGGAPAWPGAPDQPSFLDPEDEPLSVRVLPDSRPGQWEHVPASFAQERLWFLDQLEPNSPLYNTPVALHLQGPLRRDELELALRQVMARHESLRTNFVSQNGLPLQAIRPSVSLNLALVDLGDSVRATGPELAQLLTREARRPFNLSEDVLLRAVLFRLSGQEHVLLVTFHHIVCDEWSLGVFFKELALAYSACLTGCSAELPELPIQYADYALWQRDWLRGPEWPQEADYWKQRLHGASPRLALPQDFTGSLGETHLGRREHLNLPASVVGPLSELSRRQGVTLFTTLLASFKVLLQRSTAQDDIVLGVPMAGRTQAETQGLIGFFVNTVLLRTDLAGDPTFVELLNRVRQTTLGAIEHQDLPFEKLIEELHPERSGTAIPFLQVVFALERSPEEELLLPDLEARLLEVDTHTSKFDLTWVVKERRQSLEVCVEYAAALFSPATVRGMLQQWQTILEAIGADPFQPISRIPLLTPQERERILVECNSKERPRAQRGASLAALFEARVAQAPQALAVRYGGTALTYDELNGRANQLAQTLRASGVEPGALVGLCAERSIEFVVGMLGIVKAGAAYVPLDPALPRERIALILDDAQAPVVLVQEQSRGVIPAGAARILSLDSIPEAPRTNPAAQSDPNDLAYVMFTSGSTGRPKGVQIKQSAVINLVCETDYVELTAQDRVAQASNVSFDAATFEIWGALLNGAALIGISREILLSPADLAKQLRDDRITTLFVTTALFNQLAAEVPGIFHSLKQLLFGGEAVDPKWVRHVLEHQPPERVLHVYGPTETTTFASWFPVKDVPQNARTVPIGRAVAGARLYLLDRALEPVPVGVPGEICIGGRGVAQGYLREPGMTAQKFVPDPFSNEPGASLYRTGDLGRYRADGTIEFVGRMDHQVKIRGFRVELGDIEAALAAHPGIQASVVVACGSENGQGKRLAAYVVPKAEADLGTAEAVRQYLADKLPAYMIPAFIVPVTSLALNANGKVDRSTLPTLELAKVELEERYVAPRTSVEERLAALWSGVLGIRRVGVRDNFFELGGHSLLAVRLFGQIEKEFGKKLPLATLFKSPTVEQLGQVIRQEEGAARWPLLVEIQGCGSKPPLYWTHSLGGDGGGAFFYYRKLAELMGPDQPSYGIRSPQEPFHRIQDMAEHYVDELVRFQPEGPYFLGGFCFGGIVAYEMARLLTARGRKVGLLALLESAVPHPPRVKWDKTAALTLANNLQCWCSELWHESPAELCLRLRRKGLTLAKRLQRLWPRTEQGTASNGLANLLDMSEYPRDYVRYAEAHWQALLAYEPQPYEGRVTLFRARKQPLLFLDTTLGWGHLARGGVAVNVIPGTHEKMLEPPNVQILASELKACLVEAQTEAEPGASTEVEVLELSMDSSAGTGHSCSIVT